MSYSPATEPAVQLTRYLIWVYLGLLIIEGALRKWVVPGLSTPLLIVRDPVVIAIYAAAMQARAFPANSIIRMSFWLCLLSFFASSIANVEHPGVTLFGLRTNFLHLPLIFVIPAVFDHRHVLQVGNALMLIAPVMLVIVFFQFRSGPDSWWNLGAGAGSGQLGSAFGKVRASGTFSFTTGLASYIGLLASFVAYSFFSNGKVPRWLMFSAAPVFFLLVALSSSRSALSMVVLVGLATAVVSASRPRLLAASLGICIVGAIIYASMSSLEVVQEGFQVFDYRLGGGGGIRQGLIERYLGTLLPVYAILNAPFLGHGIGMGTNAAAGMLTGTRDFMLAENEWDRVVLECGPILGLAYIVLRLIICLGIGRTAIETLRNGDVLAVMLFASAFSQILNGQFAQPTALGFAVFHGGLCLAAGNLERTAVRKTTTRPTKPAGPVRIPGRAVGAARLHEE